jgi:uncharacterized membrane protein
MNAGALWRDEVNSLEVATMRTFSEMWSNLSFDSFPAFYFLILRAFAGVPASASDAALRGFGVAIGLLILGAVWLNAKWLRLGFPLLTLALIGFNPMVIRYGDSIRSYGLGILLALLMIGAMWRLLESFTLRRVALAATVAVLSVQSLYYNSFLLFAVCLGAATVTLVRRQWKQTLVVLGIGALAAISLLPYVPTMQRVQACSFMWKRPCTFLSLWQSGADTLGAPIPYGLWFWSALFVVAVVIGSLALLRKMPNERLIFAFVALVIGTICYAVFLRGLSYIMQPWYYVAFVAFAVTCIEMIFSSVEKKERALLLRSAGALALVCVAIFPAQHSLAARQTNVDIIAGSLEKVVGPDDLIVINAWNYGISFRRYYHGAARFTTVPPIEDLRSHRVDLAKQQMMSAAPLAPVLQQIEETLRAGNTVWVIGGLKLVQPGQTPLEVPPGFDGPEGWNGGDFYRAWSEQVSALTRRNAESFQRLAVPVDQTVVRFENIPLSAFRGWRSAPDDSRLSYF